MQFDRVPDIYFFFGPSLCSIYQHIPYKKCIFENSFLMLKAPTTSSVARQFNPPWFLPVDFFPNACHS